MAPATIDARSPIGVFDSGVGGLTVLAALCERLPQERFVYLGDTARLPYGIKSPETVVRYALQAADALVRRGVKALVIACNTASAVALPAIAERYGSMPLMGVVEPGAAAAAAASRTGQIAVLGTEATVRGGAYQRAISHHRPDAQIRAIACQLFVALAEEGWTEGPIARATAERYLSSLVSPTGSAHGFVADTLVLGCTHFPMLSAAIRAVIGDGVRLVDSAVTTAQATREVLLAQRLLAANAPAGTRVQLLATDGAERFAAVGTRFLGRQIAPAEVELVDL
ncbi:MAG TPA: glutamate racemase [Steroidobacteraceae bacterium]|jgi:glutamate racemase|nr:glutamate racemase [Steroidobacteraceae bacterium]